MSIQIRSTLNDMDTIMKDMDRIWSEIFPIQRSFVRIKKPYIERTVAGVIAPALDMIDLKDKILVKVEMPGVKKKDVVITIDEGKLKIKASIDNKKEAADEYYYNMERNYSGFSRSISLPTIIDEEKISASLKDGILEITLPKAEEVIPRKIEVEVK